VETPSWQLRCRVDVGLERLEVFVLKFLLGVECGDMFEAEVSEPCVTKQGIALNVTAVIAAKVGNDAESIVNAG
jgi:hypothetical protein